MNMPLTRVFPGPIVYPESDGKPMADNSRQFRWILALYGNIAAMYRSAQDVYVWGNMFWYPVEGHPEIVIAPDVFVVFGRPRGERSSYCQWLEDGVPLTVVFEVLSPGNDYMEMDDKLLFYEEHGVLEYYIYDPEKNRLKVYIRRGDTLVRIRQVDGFISPRLAIRFDLSGTEMVVYRPDGQRFLTFEELDAVREESKLEAEQARQQVAQAMLQAEQAEQRAALLERLLELTIRAQAKQVSAEDLAELEGVRRQLGK